MPEFDDWESDFPVGTTEETEYVWDVVKTGLRFLIFTCLLYTFFVWGISKILVRSDILSGEIRWHDAGLIALGIVFVRMWERTFFK